MSFILESAARFGCASPQRVVERGVGSVNESAPKPTKLLGLPVNTSKSLPEGAFFVEGVSAPPLTEALLKRTIDAIARREDYSFIFGEGHTEKSSAGFDTPLDCAKAGHYKIKRHYKELDLFDIVTPAGEFTISGYQLNAQCPDPRV